MLQEYTLPSESSSFYDCIAMVDDLPSSDHPRIFGMDENVIYDYKKEEAFKLIKNLKLLQPDSGWVTK